MDKETLSRFLSLLSGFFYFLSVVGGVFLVSSLFGRQSGGVIFFDYLLDIIGADSHQKNKF